MSVFDLILLIGIASAAIISAECKRGLCWLALIAVSYFTSGAYWRLGLPHGEFVTGILDVGVCLAIFIYAKQIWELRLWRILQTQVLVSILFLTSNIFHLDWLSHDTYSIILEALNWIAIILIGTTASLQRSGYTDARSFDPWFSVFGFMRPIYAKAKIPK